MSEHTPGPCPNCGVNASEVMPLVVKLRLQRDELLAALEANQWNGMVEVNGKWFACCPCCCGVPRKPKAPPHTLCSLTVGHEPDCEYAAAIQAARGE